MTANDFINWLRGFVDYQQLQANTNPAFNTIKNKLEQVSDTPSSKTYTISASDSVNVSNGTSSEYNSTTTYKIPDAVTHTTK